MLIAFYKFNSPFVFPQNVDPLIINGNILECKKEKEKKYSVTKILFYVEDRYILIIME